MTARGEAPGPKEIYFMAQPLSKSFGLLVRAAWEATKSERFKFYSFITLFILSTFTDLLQPWVIATILNTFDKEGITDQSLRWGLIGIAGYVGLRILNTLFHHTARYLQNTVAFTAKMATLEKIFGTLMRFPLTWHVRNHSGENLSRLYRAAGSIETTIGTYSWQVVEGVVKVLSASAALFVLDSLVAFSVLATASVTILAMIMFNKRLTNRIRRNFSFANKLNRICVDYLVNITTVKTLGLEPAATTYLSSQKKEGLSLSKKISKYSELKWCTTSVGHGLVTALSLVIYFYLHKIQAKPFVIGEVYVLLSYLDRIFGAIGSFTGYYGGLIEASTGYEDATNILNEYSTIQQKTKRLPIDPSWRVLSLRDLTFSYQTGEIPGIAELNIDIHRREKVALVGPSGGGKSTFLKVLAGLLSPETYQFFTDRQRDIPIEEIAQVSLLVPQEPEVFSESLYYNLTMGEDLSDEELKEFIELARLEKVLAKLPNGWSTDLAEGGLNLSVGEKQRVAIARGLLRARDKAILLLDEPTSSLDPKTEKEVFINLLSHFSDRTIVTACHRLNLVPLFDKVIFIRSGHVEEVGTFDELIAKEGSFFRAWDDYQRNVHSQQESQEVSVG